MEEEPKKHLKCKQEINHRRNAAAMEGGKKKGGSVILIQPADVCIEVQELSSISQQL